jgi:hypothetical protein
MIHAEQLPKAEVLDSQIFEIRKMVEVRLMGQCHS